MEQTKNEVVEVEEEQSISLLDILFIVKKHIIAILIFIVVGLAGGFIYNFVAAPVYKSQSTMIVMYESKSETSQSQYNFANSVAETYSKLMKENVVLNEVAKKTDLTVNTISKNLTVSTDSLIINLSYTDNDPTKAKEVLTYVMKYAIQVSDSVDSAGDPVYKLLYNNLAVMSSAEQGVKQSKTVMRLGIGAAIGLAVAVCYVFIREFVDNRFSSTSEVERYLGLPVLSGIPYYTFEKDKEKGGNK